MRVVQVHENGGPEVLRVVDVDEPEPGPGELLVEVAATGVNYIDTYQRSGVYARSLPYVPGSEVAGTVVALGPDVGDEPGLRVGDRVATVGASGAYAERVLVPASVAVPVPEGISDETAAALMLQGLTAHFLATSTAPVVTGQDVLVHAAAGGVGLLLTQIATLRGGRVLATVSTDEKAALAREAGAAEIIRYDREDVPKRVRALTDGVGVATVFDGVGRDTFAGSLDSLRPRGTMVLFGQASGAVEPFDPQVLAAKGSLYLTRPSMGAYLASRQELLDRVDDIFAWVVGGSLQVRIGARYPLSDAASAHADLEGRRTTGKVLLTPA
jgi:NADPH:quinone reductase